MSGVTLEFDTLLEVDEIEFDLVRTAPKREIGDHHMEEGRFSRTGFAGDQRVLAGPLPYREILHFGRTGAANGNAKLFGGFLFPDFVFGRGYFFERHFDAISAFAELADFVQKFSGEFG